MTGARTLVPSARRLMTSLRDIGYEVPAAVADLVDNSIDAEAEHVAIDVHPDGAASWLRVVDDGWGMTARELDEAMRYGSTREYGDRDLGHFGLGLKTASLSQCRRLTVASRTTARGRIEVRRWDLDRVARLDEWSLERLTPGRAPLAAVKPLRWGPGTVVLWEKLDRVLGYANPDGGAAHRALETLAEDIREHLAMVFHRFLAGDTRSRRRLRMVFNREAVRPWDPFAREESATQRLPRQRVSVERFGRAHSVQVQPYILPNQIQFSSPEAHMAAAGPKRWNRQQGLYIYRRDRLIQSGGWNRLRTLDEHSKLARVALHIPPALEEAFQINVSKARVTLPEALRPTLRTVISGVVTRAQESYRGRVQVIEGQGGVDAPDAAVPQPGWRLAEQWSLISGVIRRELVEHPELADRILLALVNETSLAAANEETG